MDPQVWVDALDVVEHRKQVRWRFVDIELAERCVTTDVVERVSYGDI